MPLATMQREMATVLEAVMADPGLGERERELLLAMYRELLRQRRAQREAGEPAPGEPAGGEIQDRG